MKAWMSDGVHSMTRKQKSSETDTGGSHRSGRVLWLGTAIVASTLAVAGCNEFQDFPPAPPTVASPVASQFQIQGRWDGITNQGRPVRFDIQQSGGVHNGTISLHHDCSGGRLVLQLTGYESVVNDDSFEVTMNWRQDEDRRFYTGTLTVSGIFESNDVVRGGFINSITDKLADNLGVCNGINGSWEATKSVNIN